MSGIDDVLRRQQEHIDKVGWSVMAVLPTDDDPGSPYAYTVGLTAHDYPELVIAGLPPHIAHALLNDLAARVWDRAERYAHGQRVTDLLAGYDAVIVDGPATEALHPGAAFAFYGTGRVRLQQVVWPDPHGRLPWEPGYRLGPDVQPLIGRPWPRRAQGHRWSSRPRSRPGNPPAVRHTESAQHPDTGCCGC